MKISGTEYSKVLEIEREPNVAIAIPLETPGELPVREVQDDAELIAKITHELEEMPDVREEVVADIRARIEAGTYRVSSDMVAELMIRRAKADSLK